MELRKIEDTGRPGQIKIGRSPGNEQQQWWDRTTDKAAQGALGRETAILTEGSKGEG
jgi:hypothetical protein